MSAGRIPTSTSAAPWVPNPTSGTEPVYPCRMTWFHLKPALPYHRDQDYRDSFVQMVKNALGQNTPVDITVFESWGEVEVDTDDEGARILSRNPMVSGEGVRSSIDRGMNLDPRVIV